jgi:hypothetical protein
MAPKGSFDFCRNQSPCAGAANDVVSFRCYTRASLGTAERRLPVANREQRGNREKRKPKAERPKQPVPASSFARPPGLSIVKSSAGKKGR